MSDVLRVALDGGGSILVQTGPGLSPGAGDGLPAAPGSGPVKAGRLGDAVEGLAQVASCSLREALEPVTRMSQQVLEQLSHARPRELKVEFGVVLSAQAGAVLAKAGSDCHLTITMTWGHTEPPGQAPATSPAGATADPTANSPAGSSAGASGAASTATGG